MSTFSSAFAKPFCAIGSVLRPCLGQLDNDQLTYVDAESALLNGSIFRIQPAESDTSERYTVQGIAADLATGLAIVCRFDEQESLLIITAYEVK